MQETHLSSTMRLFFWFRLTVMVIVWQTIYSTINDHRLQLFFKNLCHFWKLGRWIAHWVRDGTTCHSFYGGKILNSFCTYKGQGNVWEITTCYLQMHRNESKVRNDNVETVLASSNIARGATKQWREQGVFQSTAFYTDKCPKSPRSYCQYLQGRKLRKNIIIASIWVLMNRTLSSW